MKAQMYTLVTDTAVIGRTVFYPGDTNYWIKTKSQSGRWIVYYDSTRKQIAFDINYKSTDRYDLYSWYRNGQQKKIDLNIDSMPFFRKNTEEWNSDGQHIRSLKYTRDSCIYYNWFPNGQLALKKKLGGAEPWKDYQWTGVCYSYRGDGVLFKVDTYYKDSSEVRYVFPSGKVRGISMFYPDTSAKKNMREDQREEYRITYYENGQVISSIFPAKGKQPVIYYYESGAKKEEGEWQNGRIGKHILYYENGKIQAKGEYSVSDVHFADPRYVNHFEIKSDHWVYYDEGGNTVREEWYDGTKMKYKTYGKKRKVESEGEEEVKKTPVY